MKTFAMRLIHAVVAAGVMLSSIPHAMAEERPVVKSAAEMPLGAAVGVGQTLLVMMTLAGVELTAQQIQKNGGHHPTAAQLSAIASQVASATVNSPQIWTSVVASGGFSIAQKPALALGQVFLSPKLRAAFAPLLARAITSTIAFVGWDFGAQLWTEASLLLKSPDDYKIAMSSFGMSKGLLTTALASSNTSNSNLDRQRSRVAKEMMHNMLLVLSNSDLRSALASNFLRTDLMTGEFQSMLASFIAAGAVGTAIFPGAGTLAGLIFGAVGIVGAQFVPQPTKDRITNSWQMVRAKVISSELKQNFSELRADVTSPYLTSQAATISVANDFNSRKSLRSRLMTVGWERMFLEARAHQDLSTSYPRHFEVMKQFYVSELIALREVGRSSSNVRARTELRVLFQRDEFRCQMMIDFFDALKEAALIDPRNDELIKAIEAAESRGFDETNTVAAWTQTMR